MYARQMHEQFPDSSECKPYKSFVYRGGVKEPSTRKRKEQIIYDELLQAVEGESDSEFEAVPLDPGEQLLASIQNIVRQPQVNATSGRIQKLKALFIWFEQEPREDSNSTGSLVKFAEGVQEPNNKHPVAAPSNGLRVLVESPSLSAPPIAPFKVAPKNKDAPKHPVPVIAG